MGFRDPTIPPHPWDPQQFKPISAAESARDAMVAVNSDYPTCDTPNCAGRGTEMTFVQSGTVRRPDERVFQCLKCRRIETLGPKE